MRNSWKKTAAFVLAFTLVAAPLTQTAGKGGLFGGSAITAKAADYSEGDDVSVFAISVGDTFSAGTKITRDNRSGILPEIYVDDYCVFKYYGPGTYTVNENLTLTAINNGVYYFDSTDTNDLTNATVTVDVAAKSTTVKIGDKNVGPAKYDVKYGSTLENATADFPTQAGSYYAFVTAKETAGNYIGQAKSEAFTVSAEGAVTWTDISANKSQDGISITSSGVDFMGNYIYGNNGSITFTSTAGKIKKIEISCNGQGNMNVFSNISSGWNECFGDGPLVWNGTATDSVTLSARRIDIMEFAQIVYTLEAKSDISDTTVTVDTENQAVSVTRGNAFIPEDEYEVTYGTTAETATADFPTASGKFYAFVTAKADSTYYTGTAKSEAFTVVNTITLNSENVTIADFTYDGTEKTPVLKYGDTALVKDIDYELVTTEGDTASATNAGTYTIHINGKGNYAGESVALTWKINKAPLNVTAEAKSKTCGESDPELTYTNGALFGSDAFTGALTREEGENAGTYAIKQGTLSAGDNYNITFIGADFTIKKIPFTLTGASLTYNREPQNLISGDVPAGTKFTLTEPKAGLDYRVESRKIYGWMSALSDKASSASNPEESDYYDTVQDALHFYDSVLYYLNDKIEERAAASMNRALVYVGEMAQFEVTPSDDVKEAIDYINTYIKGKTIDDAKARFETVVPEWSETITATNAGTYTVYYKGSGNYDDTVKSVTATIAKAPASPEAVTGLTAAFGKTLADVTLPTVEDGTWAWDAPATSVGDVGNNTFAATFTPTDTANYNNYSANLTVAVTPISATPTAVGTLNATYGDTLADVELPPVEDGSGSWAWKDAGTTSVGNAGEQTFKAVFTPSSTNYTAVEQDVTINVAKADPTPDAVTGLTAAFGKKLSDITLPTGWTWDAPATSVGNVGNNTFAATFTPTDTANYNNYSANLTVAVTAISANPAAVDALNATYGQTLADVTLPTVEGGTWAWKDALTTSVGNAGTQTFTALYTPTSANYTAIERDITVNVAKADPTPDAVTGLTAAFGKKLSDVTLPTGWTWNAPATSVGNVGNNPFAATYTPTDTDNYNTLNQNLIVNVVAVDKTSLNEAIAAANTYLATIQKTVYADPALALSSAITDAYAISTNDNVTEAQVAQAITDVNNAVTTAKAAVKDIDDTKAAQAVTDKINALPAVADIVSADKTAVEAARAAYTNLTEAQAAKVVKATTDKLTAAEKAVADRIAADAVIEKINAIGTVALTDESKALIDAARTAYDALATDAQKALVSNYATLTAGEKKYSDLQIENAKTKIDVIGDIELTAESKSAIETARAAYNALTADQKANVANAKVLDYAEKLYDALEDKKTAEDEKAAAETAQATAEKAAADAKTAQTKAEEDAATAKTAQATAEKAAADAKTAQAKAEEDAATAKTAQATAEKAAADAKTAQTKAEEDAATAKTAQATAEKNAEAAKAAQTKAEEDAAAAKTAQATAEKNAETAKAAQAKAEEDAATAKTAQATAEKAAADAKTAQTKAEEDAAAAKTAQATAEKAAADAKTAQATAEKNAETAKAAQAKAEEDAATAKTAQATAEKAAVDAKTAQTKAEEDAATAKTAQANAEKNAEAAKAAQTKAEEDAAAAKTAQATAEKAAADAKTAQTKAEEDAATAKTAQANAEKNAEAAKAAQTKAEADAAAAKTAQATAEKNAEAANSKVSDLTEQLAAAVKQIEELESSGNVDEALKKQVAELKEQLDAAKTAQNEANEALAKAQDVAAAKIAAAEAAQEKAEEEATAAEKAQATAEQTAKEATEKAAAAEKAQATAEQTAKEATEKAAAAEKAQATAEQTAKEATEKAAAAEKAQATAEQTAKEATEKAAAAEKAQATAEQTAKEATEKAAAAEEAQAVANQSAADTAIEKINAIGTVNSTNYCENKIVRARAIYDSLTDEQKALVPADILAKLTAAEYEYDTLPQTGMSGLHKLFAGLAALMGITGIGLIKKSRKEDEEE